MTPQEFEWEQEQIESDYEHGRIGKLTLIKRMSALGFKLDTARKLIDEIDARKRG